jgi:hypothetical protein
MLCEIAPPSDQLENTYWMPVPPDCGEVLAMVCEDPWFQVSTNGAAVNGPPSTETRRLAGLVVIVICTVAGIKFPVTVVAAAGMWKLVLAEVVESKVPPVEVQLLNWKPALAVAVTGIDAPEAKNWPGCGVTEPSADGEACVVSWYSSVKVAV